MTIAEFTHLLTGTRLVHTTGINAVVLTEPHHTRRRGLVARIRTTGGGTILLSTRTAENWTIKEPRQ